MIGAIIKLISIAAFLIIYYNGINSFYFHVINNFMIEIKLMELI